MRTSLALVLVASLCAACASDLASSETALVNGTASLDESVLAVIHTRPDGTRQLCTGTLVAPSIVLTAKHCVFEDVGGTTWSAIPASDLSVSLGDSVAGSTGEIAVAAISTTSGAYHDGDGAIGGDLALLMLASPASRLTPHPVAAVVPAVTDPLRIVGFGYTGAGSTGTLGERNEGMASVVSVAAGTFTSEGASWTCTGDSGGPALRPSDGAVIGVTSIGPRGCPASTSIYTRLDANTDVLVAAGVPLLGEAPDAATSDDGGTMDDAAAVAAPRRAGGCGCHAGAGDRSTEAITTMLACLSLTFRGRRG